MDIAALLPHVEVFGGVRRYIELGNALVRRGHRFTLFTPEGRPPAWLAFSGEVRPFSALGTAAFDAGLCSEYAILDDFDRLRARQQFFYFVLEGHRREREVARRGYRFLGNSEGICRRMETRYRIDCQRAPGGVNPALFHPLDPGALEPRTGGEFRLLCYGRIYKRRKGVGTVLKAVEGLYKERPNLRLILFDALVGKERKDPRELVRTRVPAEFHIDLPQERMAWLYGRADAFVSAERRAGWSNTAAEAMACGVPVICTPAGTGDFALDGKTALVAPLPLAILLRRRLRRLMDEESLRLRLAAAGRARIADFTWDRLAARLEGILGRG
jgi:glycosyltransferase involved in cell wall biosynthesis